MQEEWPSIISFNFSAKRFNEVEDIIKIITACRNIKASLKIEPRNIIEMFYTQENQKLYKNFLYIVNHLL